MTARAAAANLPLVLKNVTVRIGATAALSDVSAAFTGGPPTAIVGPNGAGKTTLLRVAMGLLAPTSGAVSWGGQGSGNLSRRAIVFQRPVLLRRTVIENLAFAAKDRSARAQARDRVDTVLRQTGLAPFAQRQARTLSGGEQQRVALARALVRQPEILLLDEPANNLDPSATRAIEAIIREVASAGTKVVLVTHDLGQARRLAAEVLFLARGRVLERVATEQFFAAPATAEGQAFLRGDIVE